MTPFSVFPLKTMRFQMSPFSNHSTLNSVFKCLRFRSFSMETPTQKRRHSTPFSYENGVMETGPKKPFDMLDMQYLSGGRLPQEIPGAR